MDMRILSDEDQVGITFAVGDRDSGTFLLGARPDETETETDFLTTAAPHGYGYGHYISYYGHYSYILLILMGVTVLLGSLLVVYVKKIDSGIMRRSAQRSRSRRRETRAAQDSCSDSESEDLKKDLPPEYQRALEMPRPDIEDYARFFEYTMVHSNTSVPQALVPEGGGIAGCGNADNVTEKEEPCPSDTILQMEHEKTESETVPNEQLPSYDEYIQSLSEIDES